MTGRDAASGADGPSGPDAAATVEVTGDGYVRLDAALAAERFPADSLVALGRAEELWLLPLIGPEGGGVLLKQRNRRGDRAALVREALPPGHDVGHCPAVWDEANGALRVAVVVPRARGDTRADEPGGRITGGTSGGSTTSGRAISGRAVSR